MSGSSTSSSIGASGSVGPGAAGSAPGQEKLSRREQLRLWQEQKRSKKENKENVGGNGGGHGGNGSGGSGAFRGKENSKPPTGAGGVKKRAVGLRDRQALNE